MSDPTPPAPKQAAGLSSALRAGRALILLQLLSRLLTFALNQGLVRLASPAVFGTASIQFDLIASTVLFLSREGVRNALLRGDRKASLRLATVPFILGLAVAAGTVGLYLYSSPLSTKAQAGFYPALALYVAASLLELAIEPLYIACMRDGRMRVRVQAEGGMAIARAIVSFACLYLFPEKALLGFAVGHFAGAVWLAARYLYAGGADEASESSEDEKIRSLAWANTRQSVVKHVLTEADRIAVGRISPLGDQGGYAVAMNYGSLVARIVFQPIEETLQLHWSRAIGDSARLLQLALRLSLHLLLILPSFLPPVLPAILPLLLPRRYVLETSAPQTLQTYLVSYIPLLSLNGILEAFHTASASPDQVARQAKFMVLSSAAFVGALFALVKGQAGTTEQALIYASCAAMVVRIAYAWTHAQRFHPGRLTLRGVLPIPLVVGVVAFFGVALRLAAGRADGLDTIKKLALIVGCAGVAGVSTLGAIYVSEKQSFANLKAKTE